MPDAVVIFSRSGSLPSWAIRTAQLWRPWSHTSDLMDDGRTVDESVALRGGVVDTPLPDLLARSSAWQALALPVSDEGYARGMQWSRDVRGGYDWLGAVGAAWLQWRHWDDPARWWCSERSAYRLQVMGALTISPHIRGVMPTQLYDLMVAAGARVVDLTKTL